jgi:hypothetical protein
MRFCVRCSNQSEQMGLLRVIELQRSADAIEDRLGHACRIAPLESHVVLGADSGYESNLFAPQSRDAATAAKVRKACINRGQAGTTRHEEVSNVAGHVIKLRLKSPLRESLPVAP